MKTLSKSKLLGKVLAAILAVALVVCLLPTYALAADVTTTTTTGGNTSAYAGAWKGIYCPGTYTVTANLSMPGKYNPVLVGVTVYANNPNNPFGATDPDDPVDNVDATKAPVDPLSNNATLTVKEDGTLELNLGIHNPIFTTQKLGTAKNLAYTATRLVKTYTSGTYSVDGRIYKLDATLGKTELTNGVASYTFSGSEMLALPLNLTLAPTGDIALQLDVDLSKVTKLADYTAVDEALANVPADLTKYTDESVKALNEAITAVDRTKSEKEQAAVDAMATAIVNATNDLTRKPGLNEVTRTEQLNLNKITTATNKLATEGWKWEPTEDGGTLTLRDFYISYDADTKYSPYGPIVLPDGATNVNIVLEGTNIVEANNTKYSALIMDQKQSATVTISEGKDGASLLLRMANGLTVPSTNIGNPYAIGADKLVLESGTVKTEMALGTLMGLTVKSGLLDVDAAALKTDVTDKDYPILVYGDMTVSGGKVKTNSNESYYGIYIRPLLGGGDFVVSGNASLEINGANYGIMSYNGQNIDINTTGDLIINSKDSTGDSTGGIFSYYNDNVSIQNVGAVAISADKALVVRPDDGSTDVNVKSADYTAVDAALAKVPADLSKYSATTAKAVTDAVSAVNRDLTILDKNTVQSMADAIENAVNGLLITVEKPTAAEGLVYTGKELTGIAANDAYTVENGTATKAGKYTATVTLKDGYVWADETSAPLSIEWSIAKDDPRYSFGKPLTAMEGQTLADITLPEGLSWADPTQSVGKAGDNDFNVIVTPADTENYNTIEVDVSVTVYKVALKPTAVNDLVYTGKELTGVVSADGYTLTGESATKAGTYTAIATLKDGYVWADGSSEAVTVTWSIAQAEAKYTAPAKLTATEGQTLANVTLPDGFTWADKTQSVGKAGENTFKAVYTPADSNYAAAEVELTVTVAASKTTDTDTNTNTGSNTTNSTTTQNASPKTADNSNAVVMGAVFTVCAVAFVSLTVISKKRKED